jgi:hypothetical protein
VTLIVLLQSLTSGPVQDAAILVHGSDLVDLVSTRSLLELPLVLSLGFRELAGQGLLAKSE